MSDYNYETNNEEEDPENNDFDIPDEENEIDEEESDSDELDEDAEDDSHESNENLTFPYTHFDKGTSEEKDLFTLKDSLKDWYGWMRRDADKPDITQLDINEIKECGKFSPEERAAEYRRRGKSPSGVIDGEYNDEYRGNDEYNDEYRDWDADA